MEEKGPLQGLLAGSGRFPDPSAVPALLKTLSRAASARGLSSAFLQRAAEEALVTADPQTALARLSTLFAVVEDPGFYALFEDPDGIRSILVLLGYSGFLSSLIQRSPGDYVWLMRQAGLAGLRTAEVMEADLEARLHPDMEEAEIARVLRANKYREVLRIGVRDLLGRASLEETVREISALAEASIEAAVDSAFRILRRRFGVPLQETTHGLTRPARFSVMGMGKLGGEELNYSSDVDLYYFYSTHKGTTTGRPSPSGGFRDSVDNHTFFVRLGELVTRLVGDRTGDGIVFRVDLRLRPEGESGEIAYSLPSLETYYQSWGRMTDRLALLKARPVGGDRRLGEELLESLSPFIWRRHLDFSALEEIGALKEKIDRQAGRGEEAPRDVKLGRGGIREIEFLVQSLQLIYGGRTPSIRERGTLRALSRLSENGHLSERDADALSAAYRFLRRVEHRLQLVEERQTQEIPREEGALAALAHAMEYRRDGGGDAASFLGQLSRVSSEVRLIYEKYFFAEKVAPAGGAEVPLLLREDLPRAEAEAEMRRLGFADPERAYPSLVLLRDGPPYAHFPDVCRQYLRQIGPRLVAELAGSPDPDSVLVHLDRFIGKVGARAAYYALLARNPASVRLLAVLFGQSPYLSGLLIRQPDLLDLLVTGGDLAVAKAPKVMAEEAHGVRMGSPSLEDELAALRRYRNGEFLRIGMGDLLGLKEVFAVNAELSDLAEALLSEALRLAVREAGGAGRGWEDSFAVAALGKMGGREMSYGSDLDLVFLYRDEPKDEEESDRRRADATRLAQRMITVLTSPTAEGVLYPIDMRMRPSGHAGPLVVSLESFIRYHQQEALPWEHQALVKARRVAGGEDFGREVDRALTALTWGRRLTPEELSEVRRVRTRMEEELGQEAGGRFYDLKMGRGGLVDVEFAVQVLQLLHGPDRPEVRSPSTGAALSTLARSGLVGETGYNTFRRAHQFFRRVEGRQRIASDRPDPRIPRDPEAAASLARRLGYAGRREAGEEFLAELEATRSEVRAAYEAILAEVAGVLGQVR